VLGTIWRWNSGSEIFGYDGCLGEKWQDYQRGELQAPATDGNDCCLVKEQVLHLLFVLYMRSLDL